MGRFALRSTLILWPLASFLLSLSEIFLDRGQQWDLRNYLNGIKAFGEGLNPYLDSAFIYPPVYLPVLAWVTRPFTYDQIYIALLVLKGLAFAGLILVWRRYFLVRQSIVLIWPIVWLAFFGTFAIDFYAGNVSILETLGLFLAFAAFTKDRLYACALLIALSATAKIAPLVFLGLLLTKPNGARPLAAGAAAFAFFMGLNYGAYPSFSRDFVLQAWSRTAEAKLINPSSLAFIRDALPEFLAKAALPVWLAYAVVIYVVSWRASRRRPDLAAREVVLFAILIYVVTVPRMKDYAFMLAVPSVIYAIGHLAPRRPQWLLALPLLLNTKSSAPALFEMPFTLLWSYYPLAVALGFWALYVGGLPCPSPDQRASFASLSVRSDSSAG